MSNLLEKMRNLSDHEPTPVKVPCALEYSRPCCQGKGFVFRSSGPYASAELCECVKNCPNCFGRAIKGEPGHHSVPCVQPDPNRVINLYNLATVPSRYFNASLQGFSNFDGNGREVLKFVEDWLRGFKPKGGRGFVVSGAVGVGKTFLLTALVKKLVLRGYSVAFTDFFQLLANLKEGYSADKSDASLLKPLLNADILLIDELGKGRNSEWELTILDQLVMGRYNSGKTIIASTNYDLKEASKTGQDFSRPLDGGDSNFASSFHNKEFGHLSSRVGPRIFSRLQEMCYFVDLRGSSFRSKSIV